MAMVPMMHWYGTARPRRRLTPKAMFISDEALQDALGASWCQALQSEQIVRLGRDYSDDSIFPCPPIADLTVLVGSSDARKFNRIGLLAAPYVAGLMPKGRMR